LPPALAYVYGHAPIARALLDVGRVLGLDARPASPGEPLPPDLDVVVIATHARDEERVLLRAVDAGVPYLGLVASPKRRRAGAAGRCSQGWISPRTSARASAARPAWTSAHGPRRRSRCPCTPRSSPCGRKRPEPRAPEPAPPRRRPRPGTGTPCAA